MHGVDSIHRWGVSHVRRVAYSVAIAIAAVVLAGQTEIAGAGVDQASNCKAKKAKAVGSYASSVARAFGKNAKIPNTTKLAEDISKAQVKISRAFTVAEYSDYIGSLGCATTGDVGAQESKANLFIDDVLEELCPP